MARTICFSDVEVAQARLIRDQAQSASELRKALSVLLIAELGLDSDSAAEILGTSKRTVFRNRRNICVQDGTSQKNWGGRRNCSMTIEEEREFLSQWADSATAGQVLSVPPIHVALVEHLGYATPTSTTYRLLARHGWRKVQPDTKHPKSDPIAQEEFKKNSPKLWMPPA